MPARRELLLLYASGFVRSFGTGLVGVVLGIYLFRVGFSSTAIGAVIGTGLAGAALATTVVTLRGDQLGRRRTLIALALLSSAGGIAALTRSLPLMLPLAFVGMLNAMGTDRSASFALEQAIIPGLIETRNRTWALSWYNLVLDSGGAFGAVSAALPVALEHWAGLDIVRSYRAVFLGYAALGLVMATLYSLLSPQIELASSLHAAMKGSRVSTRTKKVIGKLAALFALDSLGGGFLTDALVAYWFFRRFGVTEQGLGVLFFVVHLLNAGSHLGAAWLSRRIGLVNTMVFTHLPSSVFLIAVPFAPSLTIAVALFLLRETFVEMDVPTRQSYVTGVVGIGERTFASGVTNLSRNAFWAVGSSVAGAFMQQVFSAPLVIGGGLKILYDLLLYRNFRRLKPPEETRGSVSFAP